MNKIRIVGGIILLLGIASNLFLDGDLNSLLSGLAIGLGIGLLITGRIARIN